MRDAIDIHGGTVLLDVAALSFCDARGLSALMRMSRHARQAGSSLRLLAEGRLPECWIPPGHILECRALLETYHDLRAEHTAWVDAARHLTDAKVLAARLYGVGPFAALAMTCWPGGAGRFSSSRQAVRFAGLDVTVWSSDRKGMARAAVPAGTAGAALGGL